MGRKVNTDRRAAAANIGIQLAKLVPCTDGNRHAIDQIVAVLAPIKHQCTALTAHDFDVIANCLSEIDAYDFTPRNKRGQFA